MKHHLIIYLVCITSLNTFAQITVGNTTLQEREVIGNLDIPWEIKWGYDGFIWMTERPGIVSRVNVETGEKNVILDIENTVYSGNNEAGLLGMEFHPDFETNHILFVTYTYTQGNQIKERLSSFTYNVSSEMLENEEILLNNINGYTTHIGSRILALEDLTILISTGDAQDQPASQDVNELTGKILRMDISSPLVKKISSNMFLLFTGKTRNSSVIQKSNHNINQELRLKSLEQISKISKKVTDMLINEEIKFEEF